MIRQPPRSHPFPYTTPFRSPRAVVAVRFVDALDAPQVRLPDLGVEGPLGRERPPAGLGGQNPLDRKSTRLNSSHANISYAVFCLNKQNNPRQLVAVTFDQTM